MRNAFFNFSNPSLGNLSLFLIIVLIVLLLQDYFQQIQQLVYPLFG